MTSKTQVKCPTCKKPIIYEESPARPFCSERCKLIDLGEWASESFKIPVQNSSNFNENETDAPPRTEEDTEEPQDIH
ncbi:MAG: DNA gyrase inhibitor YacG [Bdellovibrionales bacterium]|nr:DNA gyrase inhibitor YacG [Bdellovibrionales bacterium]